MTLRTTFAWLIILIIVASFMVTTMVMLYQLVYWPPYNSAENTLNFQINLQMLQILGLYAVTLAILANTLLRDQRYRLER